MPAVSARVAVIVVSKGRPEIIREMIPHLNVQTLLPTTFILSVTERADADFDLEDELDPRIDSQVVHAPPGICSQRNAAIDRLPPDIDYVVFYDDDFFPSRFALEGLVRSFERHPDVDGITGRLIADGIVGPGLTPEQARHMLSAWDADFALTDEMVDRTCRNTFGLYGCNMAYRAEAMRGLRFDEALPVYGWQEDVDFAAQLAGRRVEVETFTGVHLGTKSGRETKGSLLGYSQVVNPYYLWRKGTLSAGFASQLVVRNVVANHLKALRPEPWVDRRGRLKGNWAGIRDILAGRADPRRILSSPDRAR
ncbi:glycosyltransferase family 2 protein [Histidinibacterium aquaticum]|uniref:Glycosyltransferase n=1 Tax=Histidinibacterium aquaticum TaxID=2613962 RepID=A0A5J5GNX7_9RHOB|nr:glycosyltransferase [Histidinibacterium aquaticum]KAA9009423.1 glycosyltransferase [Histidinibacterium aquaticum]